MATRVMIGSAGAISAPEVAWSLVDAGYEVYVFAPPASRPALRRASGVTLVPVEDPRRNANRAVDDLLAAVARTGCEVFLPLDDASLWLCGPLAAAAPGLRLPIDARQLALSVDKFEQIEAARRAGLRVPPTTLARSESEALATLHFPCFVKGAMAIAREGDRLVRDSCAAVANLDELRWFASRWNFARPMLVQPALAGTGMGMFGLATQDGVRAWSAHRRVRMMNPSGSGSSACEAVVPDPKLAERIERMLADYHWRGMFMVELLRDAEGNDWFMELNGRSWGSMALARRAGFEYPAWTVRLLLDESFRPAEVATAPLRCRNLGREIIHLLTVLRGPKSSAATRWPSRWRTLVDLLRFEARDRWYNWRRGESGVFWQDAWDTVWSALQRKKT